MCSTRVAAKRRLDEPALNTQGGGSLRAAVATVFGHKTSSAMLEVREDLGEGCGARLAGMVSRRPRVRQRRRRQAVFFVNGRPVDLPKPRGCAADVQAVQSDDVGDAVPVRRARLSAPHGRVRRQRHAG